MFLLNTYATLSEDWDNLRERAEFVLCHPNGWEGVQQAMMRQAAISVKLVPNTPEGRSRVKFVTEGEASLHCCLHTSSVDVVSPVTELLRKAETKCILSFQRKVRRVPSS